MFSQKSIDSMSIQDLVKLIRTMSYSLENHLSDDGLDALDYAGAICNIADSVYERIQDYVEDVA